MRWFSQFLRLIVLSLYLFLFFYFIGTKTMFLLPLSYILSKKSKKTAGRYETYGKKRLRQSGVRVKDTYRLSFNKSLISTKSCSSVLSFGASSGSLPCSILLATLFENLTTAKTEAAMMKKSTIFWMKFP